MPLLSKGGLLLSNSTLLLSKGELRFGRVAHLACVCYAAGHIVILSNCQTVKLGFALSKKCHYYNKYIYLFNSEPKWCFFIFKFDSLTI